MSEPVTERRVRTWKWSDLFLDKTTGRLRESALWSNIGKLSMTWGFIWYVHHDKLTEFFLLAYGLIVCGHELGSRMLNQKQQQMEHPEMKT